MIQDDLDENMRHLAISNPIHHLTRGQHGRKKASSSRPAHDTEEKEEDDTTPPATPKAATKTRGSEKPVPFGELRPGAHNMGARAGGPPMMASLVFPPEHAWAGPCFQGEAFGDAAEVLPQQQHGTGSFVAPPPFGAHDVAPPGPQTLAGGLHTGFTRAPALVNHQDLMMKPGPPFHGRAILDPSSNPTATSRAREAFENKYIILHDHLRRAVLVPRDSFPLSPANTSHGLFPAAPFRQHDYCYYYPPPPPSTTPAHQADDPHYHAAPRTATTVFGPTDLPPPPDLRGLFPTTSLAPAPPHRGDDNNTPPGPPLGPTSARGSHQTFTHAAPRRSQYAAKMEELELQQEQQQVAATTAGSPHKKQGIFADGVGVGSTKPWSPLDVITNWQQGPARDGVRAASLHLPQQQQASSAPPARRPTGMNLEPPVARLPPFSGSLPAAGGPNGSNSNNNNGGYLYNLPHSNSNRAAAGSFGAGGASITTTNNHSHKREFEPMVCVQNPAQADEALNGPEILHRVRHGISLNYKGQSHNANNISRDIPHSENAALWLTNLPPGVTVAELLGAIAAAGPVGRVWSLHINPPREVGGAASGGHQDGGGSGNNNKDHHNTPVILPLSYRTSAAKLIFYQPVEAQRLLALTQRGAFVLPNKNYHHTTTTADDDDTERQGNNKNSSSSYYPYPYYQVRATHNRQRVPAQPANNNDTSRVLLIAGPRALVAEAPLRALFSRYFVYQTEAVVVLAEDDDQDTKGRRVLEWRFGSARAQAQAAFRLLRGPSFADAEDERLRVHVAWGTDPCETGVCF